MQDPKGQAYYPPQAQAYPQQPQPYSPQPQAYPPQPQAYAPQHNPAYTGAPVAMSPPSSTWRSGLTACCDDCFVCGLGMYLPACLYGEIYRKLHGDDFWFACCLYYWCGCFSCCFANKTRSTLRSKYGLPEDPCSDCCVHCWCNPCAMCQEYRELRSRESWTK
ncbi:PLAC8 family-domain-containing protein [Haematococcus lacustris]